MGEWVEKWSNSRNRPYYFNSTTGESAWEKPKMGATRDNRGDEEVHCAHILVKHAGSRRPSSWRQSVITISVEEALRELEELKGQIASFTDFQRIASERSDCSSAREGGDLGWFGQPFEDAAFALSPNTMTNSPVITESGVHLIWRID